MMSDSPMPDPRRNDRDALPPVRPVDTPLTDRVREAAARGVLVLVRARGLAVVVRPLDAEPPTIQVERVIASLVSGSACWDAAPVTVRVLTNADAKSLAPITALIAEGRVGLLAVETARSFGRAAAPLAALFERCAEFGVLVSICGRVYDPRVPAERLILNMLGVMRANEEEIARACRAAARRTRRGGDAA